MGSAKYLEDDTNKKLAEDQKRKMKEYRNNPKYRKDKNGLRVNQDINVGANSFYFTDSGQTSKFVNDLMDKTEENMLNDVIMGGCSDDDDSNINAVIKLSKKKKLGDHQSTMPCLILSKPNKSQSKFHIKMAAPFDGEEYRFLPGEFEVVYGDDKFVGRVEKKWMDFYGLSLGYQSIEERNNPLGYN